MSILFHRQQFLNILDYISVNFKMRKSCHEQNSRMLQAYELYQKGEYNQSINIYESILEKTSNKQLRFNLLCTISVISSAIEVLQYNIYDVGLVSPLVKIRYYSNLCFLQIIMGFYDESLNTFKQIKQILEQASNFSQLLGFVLTLFFRVPSLQHIEKQTVVTHSGTLLQGFYLLNLAFAKEVCGFQGSESLLKAAYSIFIGHKKIELGLVCVRQLLLSPIGQKDVEKYEKQLSKIISMEGMENYQLDNAQSFNCCKLIAQQLVCLSKQLNLIKNQNNRVNNESNLWKLILKYENRKILVNLSIGEQERSAINKNITMMLNQSNDLVISQMKRTDFYANAQREVHTLFSKLIEVAKKSSKVLIIHAYKKIQIISNERQSSVRKMNRNKSQNAIDIRKQGKQNILPVALVRDRSTKSLIDHKNQSSSIQTNSVRSSKDQSKIKMHKMIKFCQYGSFLSKRNFNSDGGEYRFVRVTQSILKWAKNPQKIEDSNKFIPLKDIRGITYGKCTPNLLKQSNHLLKEEYCFSLKLCKRTLDFYCKDFEQVSSWVCGLSHKLKQINPNFRGYSMGKILWKRMFFILKENFTQKLKKHQRHYYYQTAHSIILFGKNGLKLPNK